MLLSWERVLKRIGVFFSPQSKASHLESRSCAVATLSFPPWLSLQLPHLLSTPPAVAKLERTLAKANCSEYEGSAGQEDDEDGQGAGEGATPVITAMRSPAFAVAVAAVILPELESMLRRPPLLNRTRLKRG